MQIIEITNLSKKFGNHLAVSDVTLAIARGESFALLGPNGAGKTTIIRILSTLLKPTSGSVKINGFDLAREPEKVKKGIGVVSHNSFLYDELTVKENLDFYTALYEAEASIEDLLEKLEIGSICDEYVGNLSRGMKQRLSIARAIVHEPEILLLDEPSVGLDVKSRQAFYEMVKELRSKGTTILLTTHLLEEAAQLCRTGAVMHKGSIVAKVDLEKGTEEVEKIFAGLKT
ncbi:MAG: heme ABC exporter ATP-binding protein CcmA [Candidatus Hydrothermarchaeota archaeon]|nr:heme ABC exporter ATP-binding protein CcmA [Candidatus Hydrothermarchaeota archaeon]